MTLAAGPGLGQLVDRYGWALWLAAPVLGIVAVSIAVWWFARPARPATTPESIAGHQAYLAALVRAPLEREPPATGDAPDAPDAAPREEDAPDVERVVVDPVDIDPTTGDPAYVDPAETDPAETDPTADQAADGEPGGGQDVVTVRS